MTTATRSTTVFSSARVKAPVRLLIDANGTLSTAFAAGQTHQSKTLVTGDRIALAAQTTASENGLYEVNASGAPSRVRDLPAGAAASGVSFQVQAGTHAGKIYSINAEPGSDVVGTNNLTIAPPPVTVDWGDVGGTLADQTDLQAALDAKAAATHASNHTDGTDDIQSATSGQKGLATAAQITKLDGIETGATADQSAAEVPVTPTGNLAASDAQAALVELQGDIDTINTTLGNLDAAIIFKGTWDASSGSFPGSGSAQAGWKYNVSVAGTVDSVAFDINDTILAITDNASTSTFASNWFKADDTDKVVSVAGKTGAVTLDANDVSEVTDKRYMTDAQETKLDSVESGATADQSAGEIETAYNSQVAAASQAEMEAGTESAIRRMSPLRVAQAISALGGGGASDHGALTGLSDDDHTQYLRTDSTRASTGIQELKGLNLTDATELTISSGAITVTQGYHTVDTESDAASDDLDTITAAKGQGDIIILRPVHADRTIVIKHGTGNIKCIGNCDITLDDVHDGCQLVNYDGTNWMATPHGSLLYCEDSTLGTQAGDITYAIADGGPFVNLHPGDDGDTLTLSSGLPSWQPNSGLHGPGYFAQDGSFQLFPTMVGSATAGGKSIVADLLYAVPIRIPRDLTLTTIGLEVHTTGTAANARIGLYANAEGHPGALIVDSGAFSVGTTGVKEQTISTAVTDGWVWVVFIADGTVTLKSIPSGNVVNLLGCSYSAGTISSVGYMLLSSTYGALPDPFPSGSSVPQAGACPLVYLE